MIVFKSTSKGPKGCGFLNKNHWDPRQFVKAKLCALPGVEIWTETHQLLTRDFGVLEKLGDLNTCSSCIWFVASLMSLSNSRLFFSTSLKVKEGNAFRASKNSHKDSQRDFSFQVQEANGKDCRVQLIRRNLSNEQRSNKSLKHDFSSSYIGVIFSFECAFFLSIFWTVLTLSASAICQLLLKRYLVERLLTPVLPRKQGTFHPHVWTFCHDYCLLAFYSAWTSALCLPLKGKKHSLSDFAQLRARLGGLFVPFELVCFVCLSPLSMPLLLVDADQFLSSFRNRFLWVPQFFSRLPTGTKFILVGCMYVSQLMTEQ